MSKGKVLVVDDEPDIVRTISMRLKANGYEVITALDGAQATAIALREEPDLVILDIGMPAGNGHVVAERLKASSKTCSIPIIFLTARTAQSDFKKASDLGVARYITKPFDPQELLLCVKGLLSAESV
jgi:DNA-binding response OmpR family regulator